MEKYKPMVDLNAMALFVKVVECNSFSEASARTGVAVSTVSRRVSQLEEELGIRLLERSTRQLRLTFLGQDYYEYCRRAIEELAAANLMISKRQEDISGILRLSVPPSLEKCLVLPLVSQFQARYPKARVKIWVTDRKLNFIEDGVDLALRVGSLEDSSLIARQLIEYRHVLLAAPSYLEKFSSPQSPQELRDHRLICYGDWFNESTWTFTQKNKCEQILVEHALSMNDFHGIQLAIEAGLGISELPSIMCQQELKLGKLVEVLPQWQFGYSHNSQLPLSAVYPSNRNLSRLVSTFKDFCIDNIESIIQQENI